MLDVLVPSIVALVVTLFSTPWILKVSRERGFVGKDVNKPDRPEVPSLGGLGILSGFIAGSFTLLVEDPAFETIVSAVMLSSLIIGLLGLLDDVLNLKQSVRAIMPVFASVPLAVYSVGHSVISIPFVGLVNFGLLYYVIIVPAALTITSNAFNMLEGLNGLGTGMGVIMAAALAYIGLRGNGVTSEAGDLAIILAISLIAFLYFNKYPAKIFLGNVGTYFIGSVIGSIGISGYMLTALAVLFIPYVIEFVLKARTKFKGISFGQVDNDGYMHWDSFPNSLTHVVMKMGRMREYQVVAVLWGMELVFAIGAVVLQSTVIRI
ncbi:UDP-N-acetylmuramyl pentapeptide phosphotransferase/UDP-N-acetylglucosamine-1-phosphate transferase [Metallosphaera yellowstonensis MK1]|uniref:UDP-N-acetylmuramyl pentapeptide phosphotransferase/UDP-N-acetylglucosamine-1-phosphate transferase n=1 Tax=Metallosphaera yellowstonensis MK1 TaxID=671065 RepID=H2C8T6_9CREN|nr:glycosyltransferase 4 family protein [Metallosphaera yellowstonensis]EHP68562.1 UDP-N-acetylmuramyl pentapeptide phosphotransferase/UDP-N-acetylglucosamine-1-phosphate transferase [Metallosphaera yellowstonensis MK1]